MGKLVLEGVKIADFAWVGVGPLTSQYLADYGATVIKVEWPGRPDTLRNTSPFKDNIADLDRGGLFNDFNSSKHGITLNMALPRGREIARELVQWADIVTDSFTPGVMKRFGLDYAAVKEFRPDIVYFSTCMMGQTGPSSHLPGFGNLLSALAGWVHLTGWPDREPVGPAGAWTDYMSHKVLATALLAALSHRRRTGEGAYIDQSQFEIGAFFAAPMLMDAATSGTRYERMGNQATSASPHGVYPCLGDDRWCAIAVLTEDEWRSLCRAMGDPALVSDSRFASAADRKRNEPAVDAIVGAWTRRHTAETVMTTLQAAGVRAGVVESGRDLHEDPQLAHRKHFVEVEHSTIGRYHCRNFGFRLSRTPSEPRWAAPSLGEHNLYVYHEILGYSDDEIVKLMDEGVIS
ncbi:MAG: CoA transferase [Chloroflexi bacterium]|nr:CoA transferase [Chloroflexota bacterium]